MPYTYACSTISVLEFDLIAITCLPRRRLDALQLGSLHQWLSHSSKSDLLHLLSNVNSLEEKGTNERQELLFSLVTVI